MQTQYFLNAYYQGEPPWPPGPGMESPAGGEGGSSPQKWSKPGAVAGQRKGYTLESFPTHDGTIVNTEQWLWSYNECWVYLAKFTWCNAKVSSAVAYDKNQLIYVVCTLPYPRFFTMPCQKKPSPSIPDLQQLIQNKRIAINEPTICTNVVWDDNL